MIYYISLLYIINYTIYFLHAFRENSLAHRGSKREGKTKDFRARS